MDKYETVFLMKDDITEEQRNEVINEVQKYLNKNAEIIQGEDLGKRKLAYEIRKYQYAYYYLIQFIGKADIIYELKRKYRLNENILKFIIIKNN